MICAYRPLGRAGRAPGTKLYDSGPITIEAASLQVIVLEDLSVEVPETFVWSLHVEGVSFAGDDRFSPVVSHSPTLGEHARRWYRLGEGEAWYSSDAPGVAASVRAVPEPRAVLSMLAGAITLGALKRRRSQHPGASA